MIVTRPTTPKEPDLLKGFEHKPLRFVSPEGGKSQWNTHPLRAGRMTGWSNAASLKAAAGMPF